MACLWKVNLFKKYDYCCLKCGCTVNLSLHHLFPQSLYPEFKTMFANQVVLCEECHQHYHNVYLRRDINKCNPITFLEWMGEEFVENDFKHEPVYLAKIDKRAKKKHNKIFRDDEEEQDLMEKYLEFV